MIKAIIIDIDNTLIDFHKSSYLAVQKAFIKHGLKFDDGVFQTFIKINDDLWIQVEKGNLDRPGLWAIRFQKVLGALDIDYPEPDQVEKDFRSFLYDIAIPVDGAKDLLNYLKGKYKVYAGSNSLYNQQINRLTLAGLLEYFDGIFVSEKIGCQKPSKEFFDACFENMNGVKQSEVVMIGDSITADIKGGYLYGLTTIWFDYKNTGKTCEYANYTVNKLIDIKGIL